MEFDKSKCYSSINADELKPGDKVIVADDLDALKRCVKDNSPIDIIRMIGDEDYLFRFGVKDNCVSFALAYLVERAENCTNCGAEPCGYRANHDIEDNKINKCPLWFQLKTEKKNCYNCRLAYERDGEIYCKMHDRIITDPDIPCYHHEPKNDPNYEYDVSIKGQINEDGVIVERQVGKCHVKVKPFTEEVEKAEPTYKGVNYRPFKDTDELIKVWREKSKQVHSEYSLTMPYIWVRSKFNKAHKGCLITNFFGIYVLMNNQQCFLSRLFDEYTFLDGSVCGVEE